MSDLNRNAAANQSAAAATIDQGLRAHMIAVYNYMASGLALTGLISVTLFNLSVQFSESGARSLTPLGEMLFKGPIAIVLLLAPLAAVWYLVARIDKMTAATARSVFFLYAAMLGVSLTTILFGYTTASVAQTFFITAASFGGLSLYGYTTQRSLDGVGSFLVMGLFGLIIAMIVNLFLRSDAFDWMLSVIGVVVFAGLTAYDTQKIKEMYDQKDDASAAGRKQVMGALSLYLDFINLMLFLLRFVGVRRD